jgi:hypothetical protein
MFSFFASAAGYCPLDTEFSVRILDQADSIVSNNQFLVKYHSVSIPNISPLRKKYAKRSVDQGGETTLEFSCPECPTTAHAQRSQSTAKLWRLFLRMLRLPRISSSFFSRSTFFRFNSTFKMSELTHPTIQGMIPYPATILHPHLN